LKFFFSVQEESGIVTENDKEVDEDDEQEALDLLYGEYSQLPPTEELNDEFQGGPPTFIHFSEDLLLFLFLLYIFSKMSLDLLNIN
jgi:hypothetical protein